MPSPYFEPLAPTMSCHPSRTAQPARQSDGKVGSAGAAYRGHRAVGLVASMRSASVPGVSFPFPGHTERAGWSPAKQLSHLPGFHRNAASSTSCSILPGRLAACAASGKLTRHACRDPRDP